MMQELLASVDVDGEVGVLSRIHETFATLMVDATFLLPLVPYLLGRRFGWSEQLSGAATYGGAGAVGEARGADGRQSLSSRIRKVVASPSSPFGDSDSDDDAAQRLVDTLESVEVLLAKPCSIPLATKASLNAELDRLLADLASLPLSPATLCALRLCVLCAAQRPVVRHQAYILGLDLVKRHAVKHNEKLVDQLQHFVLAGITDVWSAIRKTCAVRIGAIYELLPLLALEHLVEHVVDLCEAEESTWRAREGAVAALGSILRRFHRRHRVTDSPSLTATSTASTTHHVFLQFGRNLTFPTLPSFLSQRTRAVVFSLLRHEQLSVREAATRTYSAFLATCDNQVSLEALDDLVALLHAATPPDAPFLDAYFAESVLLLCVFLVKHIPAGLLVPHYTVYVSVFDPYLAHPASTVRQGASSVFKYLVAMDSGNPDLLKLVLGALSEPWPVSEQHPEVTLSNVAAPMATSSPAASSCESAPWSQWEWREGRLLAYELILRFLVTSHLYYVFPSMLSRFCGGSRVPRPKQSLAAVASATPKTPEQGARRHTPLLSQSLNTAVAPSSVTHYPTHVAAAAAMESKRSASVSPPKTPVYKQRRSSHTGDIDDEASSSLTDMASGSATASPSHSRVHTPLQRSVTASPSTSFVVGHTRHRSSVPGMSVDADCTTVDVVPCAFERSPSGEPRRRPSALRANASLDDGARHGCVESLATILASPRALSILDQTRLADQSPSAETTLTEVLPRMLSQVADALGDSRWELRRMGDQAVPHLAEAVLWYNHTLLRQVWSGFLATSAPRHHRYASCLVLKSVFARCQLLSMLLGEPEVTSSWSDVSERAAARRTVDGVCANVSPWVETLAGIITGTLVDKVTILAVTIAVAFASSVLPAAPACLLSRAVFVRLRQLAFWAHGGRAAATQQEPLAYIAGDPLALSPLSGLSDEQYARIVEQQLLESVHEHLSQWLSVCWADVHDQFDDDSGVDSLVSLLLLYVDVYAEHVALSRSLFDALAVIVSGRAGRCHTERVVGRLAQLLEEHRHAELPTVRRLLDLLVVLLRGPPATATTVAATPNTRLASRVLRAIATRVARANVDQLRTGEEKLPENNNVRSGSDLAVSDLALLLGSTDQSREDMLDEESDNVGGEGERVAAVSGQDDLLERLNASKMNVSDVDDEGSDWDSGSDDAELGAGVGGADAMLSMFAECAHGIQAVFPRHRRMERRSSLQAPDGPMVSRCAVGGASPMRRGRVGMTDVHVRGAVLDFSHVLADLDSVDASTITWLLSRFDDTLPIRSVVATRVSVDNM